MPGEDDLEIVQGAGEYLNFLLNLDNREEINSRLEQIGARDILGARNISDITKIAITYRGVWRVHIFFEDDEALSVPITSDNLRQLNALNDARKAARWETYRSRARAERGPERFVESLGSSTEALRQAALSQSSPLFSVDSSSSSSPNPASAPNPAPTGDNRFYADLVTAIQASKTPTYVRGQGKPAHFQERVRHAERKLSECEENWKLIAAKEQKELLENIRGMLLALAALSRNQAKYTEIYLHQRLNEILHDVPQPHQQDIRKALIDIVDYNVLKGPKIRGGEKSVSFNAQQPAMQGAPADKRAKRLKIEHETEDVSGNKIVKVKATFGYDRTRLFGKSTGSKIGNRARKYEEFQGQISDFADIAIYEYGKGVTKENPLTISYTDSKQPEAALALLLEYKKRAFLEGKPFYAGKDIKITPSQGFSPAEAKYFLFFANSEPEIPNKNGKPRPTGKCAGYCLLELERENERLPVSEASKRQITEEDLKELLQKRLSKEDTVVVEEDLHASSSPNPHVQL